MPTLELKTVTPTTRQRHALEATFEPTFRRLQEEGAAKHKMLWLAVNELVVGSASSAGLDPSRPASKVLLVCIAKRVADWIAWRKTKIPAAQARVQALEDFVKGVASLNAENPLNNAEFRLLVEDAQQLTGPNE